ncbi:helix-turn-helix domain-containing protein [Serratia fonticola]|uniref:helix-turn-helix domain-containing protein n=1 Tax=Serratia fonticola TaxID=47917 RepID=UPI0021789C8A|nr:helix-turn-helix domain-containing protein [Serratia fonticola]CAI1709062.1 putative DNA-binding transcriptional regulator [Serratia fonticola]CAI1725248.1 putative DNA-binding transcriptional regulator [Serratia fonticola]
MNNSKKLIEIKPIAHIQALQNSLLKSHGIRKGKLGQRFPLSVNDQKMCFSLVQGECEFKRRKDGLLFGMVKAPMIIGISKLVIEPDNIIIQATTPIEYMHLPLDDFLSHIETHNQWKPLTYILMYLSARSNEYTQLNTALSSYELICNCLYALIDEDFETRATVSAVQYIIERTQLSRSGIMKTLSELNTGGYIVIKRGLLIKINKLPSKY